MRFRIRVARLSALAGLPASARGSTCACTCHCTPCCDPGAAVVVAFAWLIDPSAGATVPANVSSGRIATFAGGWAGAGPTSGFSGWKSTSAALRRATPPTR